MPTIAPSTTPSPSAATAAKAASTSGGSGDPGGSFAALLGGPCTDDSATTAGPRQPVAVGGIALPVEPQATADVAVPAVPRKGDKTSDRYGVADSPMPADADARGAKTSSRAADENTPAKDDETAVVPSPPIIVVPFLAPPAIPLAPTGDVKASAPQITPVIAEYADTPAVMSATPPLGHGIQWTSMATAAGVPLGGTVAMPTLEPTGTSRYAAVASVAPMTIIPPLADTMIATQIDAATTTAIVAGPALQVFGAAIRDAARREKTELHADPASIAAIAPAATPMIAAVGDAAAQAHLDMRNQSWPHSMVAHIEQLRDAANATDTRIRLIPDALGTIDVAVKRDGDTVHVRFTAEQAATRTLIQDAQPRLAAIAEERGLRLGQTAVDAGTTGSNAQPQRQQPRDATTSLTPRPASTTATNDDADTGRLA